MLSEGLNLILILHFGFHIVAAVGGAWSFFHSYHEHKHSKWKLFMAVAWFAVAVLLMVAHAQEKC
jgi:O-antigen/teichoic acid export membrane protein